ncbi:MAG: hypothetical protein ACTSQP_05090 [Promethearchaeota archaeon]
MSELDKFIDYKKLKDENIILIKERIIANTLMDVKGQEIQIGCLYTLYGEKIEDFLGFLLEPQVRAVDKYNIALKCQEIYKILFNKIEHENFIFNQTIYIENHIPLPDLIDKIREIGSREEFEELLKRRSSDYFHIEIDMILNFLIKAKKSLSNRNLFFESKMFTVPLSPSVKEQLSILRQYLSREYLNKYLRERNLDYYILMTFSYLYEGDDESIPLVRDIDGYPNQLPSAWTVHLTFINNEILRFLDEYGKRNERQILSEYIIGAIELNQEKLLERLRQLYQLPKNINFRITYNVIKVVIMFQYIAERDKKIEKLTKELKEVQEILNREREMRRKEAEMRKKAEEIRKQEEERRKKEEERRKKEEERRKKEQERAEKLEQLLKKYQEKFGNL